MRTLVLAAVVALGLLSGCAPAQNRLKGTTTVHDAAATRVWLIHETDGHDAVIFCDTEMYKQTQQLCTKWPR